MSGLLSINIEEARGFTAIPADIDRLAIVMGCASGLPAAAAGLLAATATVASPVTLTSADLIAAGVTALAANPRRLTFTTGGPVPDDAPLNVVIVGLVAADNGVLTPGGETLSLAQTAGAVSTVNIYKTIISLDYPAADGVDATVAIGYEQGMGLSSFFLSGSAAVAGVGYGDAPDALTQAIEQRLGGAQGTKFPAAMFTTRSGTAGSFGTINVGSVTGTALPSNDPALAPFGTYYAAVRIVDDGNDDEGTLVGVTGILYQWALDYDGGQTWSATTALGTSTSIAIPNSGVGFVLEPPPASTTAFIAAVVEARADTLAHLANAVAHDAADTSPQQVALAASSAPTTAEEAWIVLNLCVDALAAHEPNITVHDGPDPVNVVGVAPATDTPSGILRYAAYRTAYNAHLGIALAASTTGLKAATATLLTTTQTFTSADLLDAGEALLAVYPRRLSFTTAGVTPGDAPSTADIVGTDYLDAPQTETGFALAQTAATVITTKAWKTVTSITYAADGGTDATIAIGYSNGVHNSADVTNTLAAVAPAQGTLKTGDLWYVRTLAPVPGTADIASAFTALTASNAEHALLVLEFPLSHAMVATVTTGINQLEAIGRDVTCLARTRVPDFEANETEAAWLASVQTAFFNDTDSRIELQATYGLITDAMTSRQYRRSLLAQIGADTVRVPRSQWPDAPADQQAGAGMPNVTLIDSTGVTVGHDEGPQGAVTGLSNSTLGNRFACVQRLAISTLRQAVYTTVPWVLYAADERIRTKMVRRLVNAMKRVARIAGVPLLGSARFYAATGATTGTLTPSSRKSIHATIFKALSGEFITELLNGADAALDTGLVQVSPTVAVAPGRLLSISVTIAPRPPGYIVEETFTISVEE